MLTRTLGRSGIEVSALGMGCWAIGGPYWEVEGDERRVHRLPSSPCQGR